MEQINDIYRVHFNNRYENKWSNYINWTSLEDGYVNIAISELDEHKDSGPIQINTKSIKYNSKYVAPVNTNMINSMLETGFIPESWKSLYIVPIPKKQN